MNEKEFILLVFLPSTVLAPTMSQTRRSKERKGERGKPRPGLVWNLLLVRSILARGFENMTKY